MGAVNEAKSTTQKRAGVAQPASADRRTGDATPEVVLRPDIRRIFARGGVSKPREVLALQQAMGNRAVKHLLQSEHGRLNRQPRPPHGGQSGAMVSSTPASGAGPVQGTSPAPKADRPSISPADEKAMRTDAEQIVSLLREQVMDAGEEQQALNLVRHWAQADDDYRGRSGYEGADYLDRFLFLLKMRVYSRRTARSAWVKQWSNAYDDLWHELEDERLDEFKRLVSRSKKQGTTGPEGKRMENAWSYVGKREALGVVGILKGMGTTLTGVLDLGVWLYWKTSGLPLKKLLEAKGLPVPQGITGFVSKSFDETAKLLADAVGVDLNEELIAGGPSAYTVGTVGGKVVGGLTTAGATAQAGVAGQALTAVQTAKSVDELYDTILALKKGPPPLTWADIVKRPDIWAQVVGVVGGAIGAAGGLAEAGTQAAKAIGKLGVVVNLGQAGLLVAAYQAVDEDPTVQASEKAQRKADLLAQIITTGALTIDARYGESFKKAWVQKAQQGKGASTAEASAADTGKPATPAEKGGTRPTTDPHAPSGMSEEPGLPGYRPKPGERSMTREQWKASDRARRLTEWAQQNKLPEGALPARVRLGTRGAKVPDYVMKNPDNYYYNPKTHRYGRIGGKQAAQAERARQMRQRIAEEVSADRRPIGFTGKPTTFGLSRQGRAKQDEIITLYEKNPAAAGHAYERLIQGEELGLAGIPRARKTEPLGKGKGGFIAEDIEPSIVKPTVHEITLEGWKGGFGVRKQHQLFLILKEPTVKTLQLTVPKLSPQALAYLERLQATFPDKRVLAAESLP